MSDSRAERAPADDAVPPAAGDDAWLIPPGDRETRLRRAIQHIMAADDFPALTRQLAEIITGLGTGEHSAQRIATIVLRDYSLTIKVVRAANSAHYRRGHRPIQSVTQAMMVLGVDAVRRLAAGLLFLEHYRRHAGGLKELLLLSLMTAHHAREAAHRLGHADPEAAYLCGMVRNIGEVLVACHFPSAYTRILRQAAQDVGGRATPPSNMALAPAADVGSATRRASLRVLGFHFEDLGDAVLEHWGMPAEIRQAVHASGAITDTRLQQLTAYAHELTTTVYRAEQRGGQAATPSATAATVHARFGARLGLARDAAAELLATTVDETRAVFADVGVSLDELRLTRQTAAALTDLGRSAGDFPALASALAGAEERSDRAEAAATRQAAVLELRERLLADLLAEAAPEAGHELHTVLVMALEACLRGGPVDRAAFCLRTPGRPLLEARLTVGVCSDRLAARFPIVNHELSAPLIRALDQRRETIIEDGPSAPAAVKRWLRSVSASRAAILPLVVNGEAVGALYMDILERAPAASPARPSECGATLGPGEAAVFDERELAFFGRIRALALDALARRRGPDAARPLADSPPPPVDGAASTPIAASAAPTVDRGVAEARRDLVLRVLRGESIAGVAAHAGVAEQQLAQWHAEFLAGAVAALERSPGG